MAPRITSMSLTGADQPRPGGAPERMIRPSACRRMRVVRWSILNRSSSTSGSVAFRSMPSSTVSWRCSSDWLRRARLRNMSLTPCRSRASSTADLMAVCRTVSIAWPTWPISSLPTRSGGASAATSTLSPRRSLLTTEGSCSSASVSAERRSAVSRRLMDRPSRIETSSVRMRPARPNTATSHTRLLASIAICWLASSTTLAVVVPAVLAAPSARCWSWTCQAGGDRPCCSSTASGTPAWTACCTLVRLFCTVVGASLFRCRV